MENVVLKHVSPYERCGEDFNYLASLDRIDSSKGYTKDNVQWTSVSINHAKNGMSHSQMVEFIKLIKNN